MSPVRAKILALVLFFPIFSANASEKSPDYQLDFESVTTLSDEFLSEDYILQSGLTPISGISNHTETISLFDSCGNGVLNEGEACDKSNFGGLSCQNYHFDEGSLQCSSDCKTISTDQCFDSGGSRSGGEVSPTPQDLTGFQHITIPDIFEDNTQILSPEKEDVPPEPLPEINEEIHTEITEEMTLEPPRFSSPILVENSPIHETPIQVTENAPIKNNEENLETETLHAAAAPLTILKSEKINHWCGNTSPGSRIVGIFSGGEKCETNADAEGKFCCLFSSDESELRHIFAFLNGERAEISFEESIHSAPPEEETNFFSEKKYCLLAILIAFFVGVIAGQTCFSRKRKS